MPNQAFLKAYEFEQKYGIDRLKLTIQKAEEAFKTYEPETIGYCKNIIESICKQILDDKDETYSDKENTQSLVGKALSALNLDNDQIRSGITNIINGTSGIAKGLGEIRNQKCITGHGATNKKELPTKTDIKLYVLHFYNLISIIMTLLDEQEVDISTTKIKFSKLDEEQQYQFRNKYIDKSIDVEYSEEDGVLFIDGKELRPSEILYQFDRVMYKQKFEEAFNGPYWDVENLPILQEMIADELCENHFDSFLPSHYGYEPPFVWFHHPEIKGDFVVGEGSVETVATIGDSKEGTQISYESYFQVKFSYTYDKDSDSFEYKLISLSDLKEGWI